MENFAKAKDLFTSCLEMYNSTSCQCAYPRYQQIIGIDCVKTGDAFKCYDTEMLLELSKPYFNIERSQLKNELTNQKWVCKKCGSIYEYGWCEFSIHIERKKLKLTQLLTQSIGKPAIQPIPLYLGLMGHSYPPRTVITSVDFEEFENYMLEK